jgi:hypothetical protein
MMNKLQGLSTTAEEVCSAMQEEVERLATRDRTAGDRLQKMLEETAALKSEGKKMRKLILMSGVIIQVMVKY